MSPTIYCWCVLKVFAKFDTSMEQLEPLSAELNVKALPVFRFYKVGRSGMSVQEIEPMQH